MFMYNDLLDFLKKTAFYEGKQVAIYEVENDLAKYLLYKDEKSMLETKKIMEANKNIIYKTICNNQEMEAAYEAATEFVGNIDLDFFAVVQIIAEKAKVSTEAVEKMLKTYEKLGVIARLNEINQYEEITNEIIEQAQKINEIEQNDIILEQIYSEFNVDERTSIIELASEISEKYDDEMKDLIDSNKRYTR